MGKVSITRELWKENKGGGYAALAVVSIIFVWQILKFLYSAISKRYIVRLRTVSSAPISAPIDANLLSSSGVSELISEADLKILIDNLDGKANESEKWEDVTEKSKTLLSYNAKCCKPKDGPFKYLSVTVFGNCSPELLRDFYMDCEYRKRWDKTVVEHEQLQIDERTGIEIGRTIKKFPLLTHREYVLAWKVWEGSNNTYYCFTKECEHPSTPRQKKYVRVAFYRSGWRIRQVPGTNACEIKMVHQEDAGLSAELARLAFSKGVWSYVCKMEDALRKYPAYRPQFGLATTAVSLMQKVPPELEAMSTATQSNNTSRDATHSQGESAANSCKRLTRKPSKKKLIANGLLLVGGILCLTHGNPGLGAKVATAFILKKLSKRGAPSTQARTNPTS